MESSQIFGVTEECHSSESGWTMYIGSPIHGDDDDIDDDGRYSNVGDGDGSDEVSGNKSYNQEDESDDSMASDASSGPTQQHVMAHFKGEKDKKTGKQKEKQQGGGSRRKDEKAETLFVGKDNAPAQSGSKVRKNIWNIGKRK